MCAWGKNRRQMLVDLVWPSMQPTYSLPGHFWRWCSFFLRWNKLVSCRVCGITLSGQDPAPVGRSLKLKIIKALDAPSNMRYLPNVAVYIWYFEPSPCDIYIYIHLQQWHAFFNRPKISAMNHKHLYIPSNTYVTGTKSCIGTPVLTRSQVSCPAVAWSPASKSLLRRCSWPCFGCYSAQGKRKFSQIVR